MNEREHLAALQSAVQRFFGYLDRTEVSDNEREFHPVTISCCRVLWVEPLGKIMDEMKKLSA